MLFSSALIGLREGLEAVLVVSILIAFLVKPDQRSALKWVWGGVAAALLICVAIGTVIAYTIGELPFEQQEIVGGEEDRYSHTDLWDFRSDVDRSQAAIAALRPVIEERVPSLLTTLDDRFAAVDALG